MAAGEHNAASRWASLLCGDLVRLIGWRVLANDLLDYVRFRAVCTLWRSSTVSPRGRGLVDERFYPRWWMLLNEDYGLCPGNISLLGYVRFFNLSTGFFVRAWLPIFEDHSVLDYVDGLVLLLRRHDNTVRLLHPFTGDIADLPPLTTLKTLRNTSLRRSGYLWSFREISATSVSVSLDGLIIVMIVLEKEHRVAFATSGRDQHWSVSTWTLSSIRSSVSFKGILYILSSTHNSDPQIFHIEPPQLKQMGLGLPAPKLVATCPPKLKHPYHLVECDSDILLIGSHDCPYTSEILGYRLADLILEKFCPITSIGGCVFFVSIGKQVSMRVMALLTIAGDTIVKYIPGEKGLHKYYLKSGTWLPPTDECTVELALEPLPGNLFHRSSWHHYDYKGDKYFSCIQGNARPRLARRNWREERSPARLAR